jgi:Flp pilus assembly protein protease CpaA
MDATTLLHRFHVDLPLHDVRYKFYVEAATVAVLCYVGFTDFRTFKIRNDSITLLVVLYIVYALVARSP